MCKTSNCICQCVCTLIAHRGCPVVVRTAVTVLTCGSNRVSLFLPRFDVISALSEYTRLTMFLIGQSSVLIKVHWDSIPQVIIAWLKRFSIGWVAKVIHFCFGFDVLRSVIGWQNLHLFLSQSEAKQKSITSCMHAISCAWCKLHVQHSCLHSDWFITFKICCDSSRNCFGFDFMTLN